jgi:hypothetical protein
MAGELEVAASVAADEVTSAPPATAAKVSIAPM